jgi:hypothetical protein
MRPTKTIIVCLFAGLLLNLSAGAAAYVAAQSEPFVAQEPALLTTAGQSADLNMAKALFDRNKVALKMVPLAGPQDLTGMGSLVIVIGGSTKGLGAAGIDAGKETARVDELMAKAAAQKIPILGMHIGGKARRGELSDKFIEQVVPKSTFLVVVKEGDSDGLFSKLIAGNKINAQIVEKLSNLVDSIKLIYKK